MSNEYRNTQDLIFPDGEFVEAGCLWHLIDGFFILYDDDRFVASQDKAAFSIA